MDLRYQQREQYESLLEALQGIDLNDMPEDTLLSIKAALNDYTKFKRYNQLAYFIPYDYQRKLFDAGSEYNYRMLCTGNQIGKSFGAAHEYAMHLTGLYSPWWKGDVFEDGNRIFWAIGVTLDSTSKVLQKLLLGTSDIRRTDDIGTGAIPRDHIDMDTMIKDGPHCKEVLIKHVDGTNNVLRFYSSSVPESVLMGQTVNGMIWADEQFTDSERLHAQFVARITTGGGRILYTMTPENGSELALYEMFKEDTTGKLYWQNATWFDCPHLGEEKIAALLQAIPEWLRKLKSEGIPVSGAGSIFPFSDEQMFSFIRWEDVKPTDNIIAAVDFGYSGLRDSSTIVYAMHDKETDVVHIIDAWFSSQEHSTNPLSHMPDNMAKVIKSCPYPNIPVICPNDASGIIQGTTKTRAQVLRDNGCNVYYENYHLPYQLTSDTKKSTSKIGGLQYLVDWFSKGLLKVNLRSVSSGLNELHKEIRGYVWKDNKGSGKLEPIDKNDHGIDAMRYAATTVKWFGQMASTCIASSFSDVSSVNDNLNRRWLEAYG